MKPTVFIGSSKEGIDYANAVNHNLETNGNVFCKGWSNSFSVGDLIMESLFKALDRCDFGVFIFSPDDVVKVRGKKYFAVRDNVLFELGLFLGRYGQGRAFFIIPKNINLKLPSDLFGIMPAYYNPERLAQFPDEHNEAMQPACTEILKKIREFKLSEQNSTEQINPFEELTKQLADTRKTILENLLLHAGEFGKISSLLETINKSTATRYLGSYPHYFDDILALIHSATKKIEIACDVPAYGCLSEYSNFVEYRHELERKIRDGVKVSFTFLNEAERDRLHLAQFKDARKSWDHWKSKEKIKPLIEDFIINFPVENTSFEDLTADQFRDEVGKIHKRLINHHLRGAKIKQVKGEIGVYFWIIDDRRAVFSIPTYNEELKENGFFTKDLSLFNAFRSMVPKE